MRVTISNLNYKVQEIYQTLFSIMNEKSEKHKGPKTALEHIARD